MPEAPDFDENRKSISLTCRLKIVAFCIVTEYRCDSFRAVGSQSNLFLLDRVHKWHFVSRLECLLDLVCKTVTLCSATMVSSWPSAQVTLCPPTIFVAECKTHTLSTDPVSVTYDWAVLVSCSASHILPPYLRDPWSWRLRDLWSWSLRDLWTWCLRDLYSLQIFSPLWVQFLEFLLLLLFGRLTDSVSFFTFTHINTCTRAWAHTHAHTHAHIISLHACN